MLNADGSGAGIKGRSAAVLKETAKGVKGGVSSVASTLSKVGGGWQRRRGGEHAAQHRATRAQVMVQ